MIQPVVDDIDAVLRNTEKAGDVLGRRLTDGNDGVLAARESLDDVTSINHPCQIVFATDVERREIVNRRDLCAWRAEKQTPIARDVERIQCMLSRELSKLSLMPADVRYGRTKAFRHCYDLH